MKKLILCALALATTVGVMAQGNRQTQREALSKAQLSVTKATELTSINSTPTLYKKHNAGTPSSQVVNFVAIGGASNCNGVAFTARTPLFAHPAINTIAMFHRNNQNVFGGTSGQLRYDLSTDGGATWTSDNGPIYDASGGAVAPFANARYPQGTIYNPIGNTTPSSAYLSFFAPTLAVQGGGLCGNASSWGGHTHGSVSVAGGTPVKSEELSFNYLIADATALNTSTNEHWVVTQGQDIGGDIAASCDYLDYIIAGKGTWNATTFEYNYTYQNLPAPVELGDGTRGKMMDQTRIAFGPDGLTGYITYIGHESFVDQTDSTRYPVVFKTIDAGASWTRVASIDFQAIDAVLATGGILTVGFDHNISVDANGNLHIVAAIIPIASTGGYTSFNTSVVVIYDIYTTDGGTSWKAQELARPQTFIGDYLVGTTVTLEEFNRPQICRSLDGTHLFFTFFDTDSTLNAQNIQPDAYVIGYNTTLGLWSTLTNVTLGTSADALMNFGTVAPLALAGSAAGCYNIPMTAAIILTDVSSAIDFKYLQGVEVCDAEFTVAGTPINLVNSAVGVQENSAKNVSVSNNYPNPFTGETRFDINLKSKSNVTIEVYNVLGKVVKTINAGDLNTGAHTIKIDASGLSSGMYTYTVTVGAEKLTGKMMIK